MKARVRDGAPAGVPMRTALRRIKREDYGTNDE
jgi:hypothetical protein